MILSCSNIDKTFVDNHVIKNASFHIEDYEKAAIVGINGAGKSTLLKIITGSMPADDGLVTFAKDKTFGYLAQHQAINSNHTIYDELLTVKQEVLDLEASIRETELAMKTASDSELELLLKKYSDMNHRFEMLNGYAYKSEITGILKGLGFQEDEFDKKVDTLSGGQKTRIALGKLLLQKPDLIMLDEPTNHLDLNSIAWLETYLLNYKGAVLIVSHDRYFLDKIATKIIEIDNGTVTVFHGNYSDYARQKEVLRTERLNAYLNQQREIKHQEEVIDKLRSFNREKSIKRAESREKMLDKIERLDKPVEVKADMKLKLTPRLLSGNDVLSVSDLSKAFDNHVLFSNVSFEVKRGEHVAIIGDNGTGKTTLLTETLMRLKDSVPCAVIEGDQQTVNDAARIRATGTPAIQVNTGKGCHLDAQMIADAAPRLPLDDNGILFIENVGNLVCPASFDLGEKHKVAVLSVTEGEDKPLKYPHMFAAASLMLLNKVDLLPYLNFDVEKCIACAREVNPEIEIILISATSGEGMDQWLNWLETQRCA